MTLTEQIINEFREKFPITVETLPLSFQEYLMEKGQTGVLFDMEHHERVKRAEAKQRYFEDFLFSSLTRVREDERKKVILEAIVRLPTQERIEAEPENNGYECAVREINQMLLKLDNPKS